MLSIDHLPLASRPTTTRNICILHILQDQILAPVEIIDGKIMIDAPDITNHPVPPEKK